MERMLFARESVLLWLAEVRRHPTVDEYVRAIGRDPRAPLDQILDRTAAAAARPGVAADPDWMVHDELRHAVFLYALVTELNATVESAVQRLAPLVVLTVRHLSLLTSMAGPERPTGPSLACLPPGLENVDAARRAGLVVVAQLRGLIAMLAELEDEYLEGHSALFAEQAEAIEQLTAPLNLIEELTKGLRRARPVPRSAASEGAAAAERDGRQLLASLLDRARVTALQLLGEAERATELLLDRLDRTTTGYPGASER